MRKPIATRNFLILVLLLALLVPMVRMLWPLEPEPTYQGKTVSQWILKYPPAATVTPVYPILALPAPLPQLPVTTNPSSGVVYVGAYSGTGNPVFISGPTATGAPITGRSPNSAYGQPSPYSAQQWVLANGSNATVFSASPSPTPGTTFYTRTASSAVSISRPISTSWIYPSVSQSSVSSQESTTASQAIRAMGAKAVPWLVTDLNIADSLADKYYAPLFARLSTNVQSHLPEPRPRGALARQGAVMGLMNLGPLARPALPALIKAADDPDPEVRKLAFIALDRLRPNFSDAKAAFDNFTKWPTANQSLCTLVNRESLYGRLGALALSSVLADKSSPERRFALCGLCYIGDSADITIPALISALHDSDSEIRYNAINALGAIGPRAFEAVPAITALLEDPNDMLRSASRRALKAIKEK